MLSIVLDRYTFVPFRRPISSVDPGLYLGGGLAGGLGTGMVVGLGGGLGSGLAGGELPCAGVVFVQTAWRGCSPGFVVL